MPAGNGRDRVTVRCDKYTVKEGRKDDPVWVDTVGWDDADLEDENTFKNILRYLKEKNLLRYGLLIVFTKWESKTEIILKLRFKKRLRD